MEIGKKIKFLRQQNNLTQEELGDRCELSKGFISQLENDMTSPSITTLTYILDALGTNLAEFFSEEQEEQVVFKDEDYAVKIDEDLKNETCWLISNAQKNEMEPILITIEPEGKTYPDKENGKGDMDIVTAELLITGGYINGISADPRVTSSRGTHHRDQRPVQEL